MAEISALGFFLPIFSFLLVTIVLYQLLMKTKVLGEGKGTALLVSLILSSFFILESSLVEFVRFNSAWVGVLAIMMFFIMALLGFTPGGNDTVKEVLGKGNWMGWVVLGGLIALFIYSAAYIFNWVVDFGKVNAWIATDWFGMLLLLIAAAITSYVITRN